MLQRIEYRESVPLSLSTSNQAAQFGLFPSRRSSQPSRNSLDVPWHYKSLGRTGTYFFSLGRSSPALTQPPVLNQTCEFFSSLFSLFPSSNPPNGVLPDLHGNDLLLSSPGKVLVTPFFSPPIYIISSVLAHPMTFPLVLHRLPELSSLCTGPRRIALLSLRLQCSS